MLRKEHTSETIQKKLSKSYFLLTAFLLLITALFLLPAQLSEQMRSLEDKISWTGYLLSQNEDVIQAMKEKKIPEVLQKRLTDMLENSEEIDYIVLADTDSIRLFHPDFEQIGGDFIGGDESKILKDPTPYVTNRTGEHGAQKRSFHQIQDSDGTPLGFVMVSASLSTIRYAEWKLIAKFLLIFLGLSLCGMIFSFYTARRIRRSLLGYEPDAIAKLFLQREEILEQMDEGILAYDSTFEPLYSNSAAKLLLGEAQTILSDSSVRSLCQPCMDDERSCPSIPYSYQGKTLLLSVLPLNSKNHAVGFLLIVRDRTEVLELADQLTGSNHIVEALRASTHEFLNKLHIISGMLQMENYEQAITFIDGLSNDTRNSYQAVIQQIQNKTIAALLLGKQSHAKEKNIDFMIQKDSFLDAHNEFLSTQELVTILGNLIENAFHAVEQVEGIRQVQLFLSQTTDGLTIIVDDTGCGMTEEQLQKLLGGSFTTKGEGHGVGFRLIQEIIKKHNGYLHIDSEPDIGSSFTISIQKQNGGI